MRQEKLWSVTGVMIIASLNSLLIVMLLAMYWTTDFEERVTAGIVLMPLAWLLLVLIGLTRSNIPLYLKINCVLSVFFCVALLLPVLA